MRVLFQLRVAVTGQHLAVGIDVDALAGCLLQEDVQVFEVMAGHEDGLAGPGAQGHLGGLRVAVGAGVAGIQQLHGAQVDFAALEYQAHPVVEPQIFAEQGCQPFVDEGVDHIVFLAQDPGVISVSGHTLESEEEGVLEGLDIGVVSRIGVDLHGLSLFDQIGNVGGRLETDAGLAGIRVAARGPDPGLQAVAQPHGLVDQGNETVFIKIHVGEGGKNRLAGEEVDLAVNDSGLAALVGHQGKTLGGMNEKILQGRDIRLLAADADNGAAFSLGSLFALVTKHGDFLLVE